MTKAIAGTAARYLDDAPSELIEIHKDQLQNVQSKGRSDDADEIERITHLALTAPGCAAAWKTLAKHANTKPHDERCWRSVLGSLIIASAPLTSDWDELPASRRIRNAAQLAKAARVLADKMRGHYGYQFFKLMNSPRVLTDERVRGLERVGMAGPTTFAAGAWLLVDLPASDVLRALAEAVEREAKEPPLLPRPGLSDARRVAFCKRLAEAFRDQFGQPLYSAVARFGAALLNDPEINEDLVRKLHIRTQRKRNSSKTVRAVNGVNGSEKQRRQRA